MLTDEQIDQAFEGMTDGPSGFLKSWGYRHFAKAIEAAVRAELAAATTPQPALIPLPVHTMSAPDADESGGGRPRYLQASDQRLLHRFIETSDDDESYDIGSDAVKRLADLGVVRNCGFGRYAVTMFGHWVHEHHWHQKPSLPLMTNSDRDARQKARIQSAHDADKGGTT